MILAFLLVMPPPADGSAPAPVPTIQLTSPVPGSESPAPPSRARSSTANLVSLFSTDDYPQEALRLGEQGTVAVRLLVTNAGRVGKCEVVTSSGSQILDRATCNILSQRARFAPARDEKGQPTTDYYTQRIRWELPRHIIPFVDERQRIVIRLDDYARAVECRFERDGRRFELPECSELQGLIDSQIRGRTKQARGMNLVVERSFETNPSGSPSVKQLTGRQLLLTRGVIEIDIDPAGKAENCKAVIAEGDAAKTPLCKDEGQVEFEPDPSSTAAARRARIGLLAFLEPARTGRLPKR